MASGLRNEEMEKPFPRWLSWITTGVIVLILGIASLSWAVAGAQPAPPMERVKIFVCEDKLRRCSAELEAQYVEWILLNPRNLIKSRNVSVAVGGTSQYAAGRSEPVMVLSVFFVDAPNKP